MSGRVRLEAPTEVSTDWRRNHAPAANTKATITQAAVPAENPGNADRNVLTALSVSFTAEATAPSAVSLTVAVIDGAAGGTTYLWGPMTISVPAVAGAMSGFSPGGLWIPGSPNTAMTIEFSAAGGANTKQAVWMSGTTTI